MSSQAVYQGEGWLAIGFSDSGNMPGSDSVIGLPDAATALEYDMDDYSTPVEAAEQVCPPSLSLSPSLTLSVCVGVRAGRVKAQALYFGVGGGALES